jgi:hypothetical protein
MLISIIDWNFLWSRRFLRINFKKKEDSIGSLVVAGVAGTISVFQWVVMHDHVLGVVSLKRPHCLHCLRNKCHQEMAQL